MCNAWIRCCDAWHSTAFQYLSPLKFQCSEWPGRWKLCGGKTEKNKCVVFGCFIECWQWERRCNYACLILCRAKQCRYTAPKPLCIGNDPKQNCFKCISYRRKKPFFLFEPLFKMWEWCFNDSSSLYLYEAIWWLALCLKYLQCSYFQDT